jgi:signal transduction histidine kinase
MRKAPSWWRGPAAAEPPAKTRLAEDRNTIVAVQWMVAIATSYLVFAVRDGNLNDPLPALLILACLISAPLLQRIPHQRFSRRVIESGLLVLDSILIVAAITLAQEIPWDLLILFFFCVFIAAIGENLLHIGLGCVLLSLAFLLFASPRAMDLAMLDANALFRVPFIFGISIFYGYMANQVRQEKRRIESLQETMRLKRQFVCALAHDIKTPLNVILGHAELLASSYDGSVDQNSRLSSLKSIRQNIKRIVELITDFLTFSKLESEQPSKTEPVQMNTLAANTVQQEAVLAREKKIDLILELDERVEPVRGDKNQLQRVLWNLIDNAIKFTPAGGTVRVASRMSGDNVCLTVTDTGIGIPSEELAIVFAEFRRLRGAANSEGTGLGLFIVKTIVEAHGGTVAVESKLGAGTAFTVVLPGAKQPLHRSSSDLKSTTSATASRAKPPTLTLE